MTGQRRLPEPFADVERFTDTWCLPTESQRYARRLASSMVELREFYDAFSPRLEDAITYCDQFALDALPDDAQLLLQLIYSHIMVAMSIEVFSQPKAVNAADAWLARVREPTP